jgi:uncharacterized protein YjbJ (UPF0337 family)
MDSDRVKGTVDEILGKAKRGIGELTGDTKLKVEGIAQQVKGKMENAWGQTKDAVRDANQETCVHHDPQVHVDGTERK